MKYYKTRIHQIAECDITQIARLSAKTLQMSKEDKLKILWDWDRDQGVFHPEGTYFDYLLALVQKEDFEDDEVDIDADPDHEMVFLDIMDWIGNHPRGGRFFPVSNRFKETIAPFNQGNYRFYPSRVKVRDEFRDDIWVWQYLVEKEEVYVDLEKCTYHFPESDITDVFHFASYYEAKKYGFYKLDKNEAKYKEFVLKPHKRGFHFLKINKGFIVSDKFKKAIDDSGMQVFYFEELDFEIKFSDEF